MDVRGCMYFPVPEKIPFSVSFRGTNPLLNLLLSVSIKCQGPGIYRATYLAHQRGDPWVSAGKPGGMRYICRCKFVDRAVVPRNSTRPIFETSRGPVSISTRSSRSIQAHPWSLRSHCLRTGSEAHRFWFGRAPRLCAYRSFRGSSRRFTAWLSRSTESILSDPWLPTRQRDHRFGER